MMSKFNPILAAGSAALAVLVMAAPASAQQRDPAYAAARAAGQVGEKTDGYLGFPVPPSAEVRRMADDINIKRRALYAQKAAEQHAGHCRELAGYSAAQRQQKVVSVLMATTRTMPKGWSRWRGRPEFLR